MARPALPASALPLMADEPPPVPPPPTLAGHPLRLTAFGAAAVTNRQFARFELGPLDRCYLPAATAALCDEPPLGDRSFLEDDNRGAVSPEPVATLDGQPFYLSVKGIGSTVEPFSYQPLDRRLGASLTDDPEVRRRLLAAPGPEGDRLLTGELWLRGSPYGGQGWEHASTALKVSESADLTSIRGFLIAPVVKVVQLPPVLQERIRSIHWYRKYPGRIVQEIRLVPSNVRVYLHAQSTLGHNIRQVFDRFGLTSPAAAHRFQTNFLRSAVAMLTVFARSIQDDPATGKFTGLDFYDVWLDKDAVLAPNGSVYFVDLEGVETISVEAGAVREKLEDQVFRSMYELAFAFEQIERERARRFGEVGSRKEQFARLLEEALRDDPVVRLRRDGRGLEMETHANCQKGEFRSTFRWVDA
jgi:hypothetical protein